jgi:hypothetical protein
MPKELPITNQNNDQDVSITHLSNTQSNTNLLAHAKKKAKKLYNLSKEKNFIIQINSLSEAQQIIAKINGYDSWHILEKIAKKDNIENHTKLNNTKFEEDESYQEKFLEKFKRQSNFHFHRQENKNVPYIIDEKNNQIITFIHLNEFNLNGYYTYNDIFGQLRVFQDELKLLLDREFSTIEFDMFHFKNNEPLPSLKSEKEIETKIKNLALHSDVIEMLKLEPENIVSYVYSEYELSIICTIKTSIFAKNEHFKLLEKIQEIVFPHSSCSYIENHALFKQHTKEEKYFKFTINIKNDHYKENVFGFYLKYLFNLSDKNMNWFWHIDQDISQLNAYFDTQEEYLNYTYLLQGYQKEISKNNPLDLITSIGMELFNYSFFNQTNKIKKIENFSNYNIEFILGRPGSGKSTLMQNKIINDILEYSKNNQGLPNIGIIDIGGSYSGLLSLIKDGLNEPNKHLVANYQLTMDSKYNFNIFDTPLGFRSPTLEYKAEVINFITLLCTDINQKKETPNITSLIYRAIDEMYEHFSDINCPKIYEVGIVPKVDEALKRSNLKIDKNTTWWNVVDALFTSHQYFEAMLAQHYAVPLISDLIHIVQNTNILNIYEKSMTELGENLVEFFIRKINETLAIYPILSSPTIFNLGLSKVVCFDLDKVARIGGNKEQHKSEVMFLLARLMLSRAFNDYSFSNKEQMESTFLAYPIQLLTPSFEIYEAYYDELKKEKKSTSFYFDEMARFGDSFIIKEQLTIDAREARRNNSKIILSSQSSNILNKQLLAFLNSIYVEATGSISYLSNIEEYLGIESKMISKYQKNKKTQLSAKENFVFYHKCYTNQGIKEKFIHHQYFSEFLWISNHNGESVLLKQELSEKMGYIQAIKMLSKIFPKGMIKSHEQVDVEQVIQKAKEMKLI